MQLTGPLPSASHYEDHLLERFCDQEDFEGLMSRILRRLLITSVSQYLVFILCVVGNVPQDQLAEAWGLTDAAISRLKERALETARQA